MFRTILLSVPFAILPLVAVQLVETVLSRSLLPEVADSLQRAVPVRDAGPAADHSRKLRDPVAQDAADMADALRLTLRF